MVLRCLKEMSGSLGLHQGIGSSSCGSMTPREILSAVSLSLSHLGKDEK